jgi:ribonuclease Y
MSLKLVAVLLSLAGVSGLAIGYYLRLIISLGKKGSMELEIKEMLLTAKEEGKKIIAASEQKANSILEEARREVKEKEEKIQTIESRLIKKEDLLDKRQIDIDKEVELIKNRVAEIKTIKEKVDKMEVERVESLEKVAKMTRDEAREEIIKNIEKNANEDLMIRIQKLEQNGEDVLENKAKDILASSIQRLANSVASDVMSTSVNIPNDEIKGKIIGKEGRNR